MLIDGLRFFYVFWAISVEKLVHFLSNDKRYCTKGKKKVIANTFIQGKCNKILKVMRVFYILIITEICF